MVSARLEDPPIMPAEISTPSESDMTEISMEDVKPPTSSSTLVSPDEHIPYQLILEKLSKLDQLEEIHSLQAGTLEAVRSSIQSPPPPPPTPVSPDPAIQLAHAEKVNQIRRSLKQAINKPNLPPSAISSLYPVSEMLYELQFDIKKEAEATKMATTTYPRNLSSPVTFPKELSDVPKLLAQIQEQAFLSDSLSNVPKILPKLDAQQGTIFKLFETVDTLLSRIPETPTAPPLERVSNQLENSKELTRIRTWLGKVLDDKMSAASAYADWSRLLPHMMQIREQLNSLTIRMTVQAEEDREKLEVTRLKKKLEDEVKEAVEVQSMKQKLEAELKEAIELNEAVKNERLYGRWMYLLATIFGMLMSYLLMLGRSM